MRREYAWRSIAITSGFVLVALAIIFQMVRIQTSPTTSEFRDLAERNKGWTDFVYPARGEIYDRRG